VREWPLTLVAALFILGAVSRYVAAGSMDALAFGLALLGSASFGAWLYAVGKADQ
jgi:hypothetical protein